MKRLLSMLLVLALLASNLPAVHATESPEEASVQILTGTIEGMTYELEERQTSALSGGFFALDASGLPTLAAGNFAAWIDRLDAPPSYATNFYQWLVENADGDGTADALIDPSQGTAFGGGYVHPAASFEIDADIPVANDASQEEILAAAEQVVSEQVDAKLLEAVSYIQTVLQTFDRDHPEVFWVSDSCAVQMPYQSYDITNDGTGWHVSFTQEVYFVLSCTDGESGEVLDVRDAAFRSPSAIYSAISQRDANANAILADIPADATQYDRIVYLNDWLTQNNCYNSSADLNAIDPQCHECISALEGRTGASGPVCEGYARAFKVLCDRLGIACVLVDGQTGSGEGHMWNYVRLDGSWYAADVTWNDPTVSGVSGAVSGYEHREYLLCGASTVIDGEAFLSSHPVSNTVAGGGVAFTNGPVLSDAAYSAAAPEGSIPETDPSNFEYEIVDDTYCRITKYIGTVTEVNIPATIEGYPVQELGNYCFWGCTNLTSITIPDSVTSLGYGCFGCCTSLTSISIPDSITRFESSCFTHCSSLSDITIPNSVSSLGDACFYNCISLTSISIPNGVTSLEANCFGYCSNLTSITIPDSVTSFG